MKISIIFFLALLFLYKNDNYAQSGWFELNSGTQNYMNAIIFLNENTGFIGADQGELFITTNAGVNWTISFTGTINSWLTDFHFFDSSTAIIAGIGGGVYKTTNGGINLQQISTGSPRNIFFSSADTGYYNTKYNGIFNTTNGGFNWFNVRANTGDYYEGNIHFFNNNTGIISGKKILKTSNGGVTWDSIVVLNDNSYIFDIHFYNTSTGLVCGYIGNGGMYKTTNSCSSWIPLYINHRLEDMHFINENTGFAIGHNSLFIKTTNGGINWSQTIDTILRHPTGIHFTNANTGYIVTTTGKILKTTTGGDPIGIQQISSEVPKVFNLYQNYPNPFNPATYIEFDISKSSDVTLIIYDVNGKEVETLINEQIIAGRYKTEWNASGFASGIYFYNIKAGEYSKTVKMVLIK